MTIKKFYSNNGLPETAIYYILGQNSGNVPEPWPINTKI